VRWCVVAAIRTVSRHRDAHIRGQLVVTNAWEVVVAVNDDSMRTIYYGRKRGVRSRSCGHYIRTNRHVEENQFRLPAPEFCVDSVRTTCILYGHRPFTEMSRADRIRASYQHCCLR
jgi:hypothetical protein